MFETLLTADQGILNISPDRIIINLLLAFILSLLIAVVYKSTHKGLSYSQTFVITLIIAGVVISAVMMVIGNNIARAFGAFGAFSLIRFRTAIKDAKDMGFIFLILAVGMAVGTNNYIIAIATTVISLSVIYILTKLNFGSIRKFDYILTLNVKQAHDEEAGYKAIFEKFLKSSSVLNIKSIDKGQMLQLSFSIKFISEKDLKKFVDALENLASISDVRLITAKNDVEF
jgi:uncharacterized membrane protein YhiD involved in acid resistance